MPMDQLKETLRNILVHTRGTDGDFPINKKTGRKHSDVKIDETGIYKS